MHNEHCWMLVGEFEDDLWFGKKVRQTEGEPCRVGFDPKWVIEQEEKQEKQEKHKNFVGFLHSHPGMVAYPSAVDNRTMGAWVNCLGRPLVCCIIGTDGLRAWWYFDDESPPIEYQAKLIRGIVFGITPEESEMASFTENKKKISEKQQKLNCDDLKNKRSKELTVHCEKFVASHFEEFVGKKGMKVQLSENEITLTLNANELVKVRFIHKEHKKYEDDTGGYGSMVGTGEYYIVGQMKLCQPHSDSYCIERQPWENYSTLNEDSLAEYLAQFID